jgi:hypothetical protein
MVNPAANRSQREPTMRSCIWVAALGIGALIGCQDGKGPSEAADPIAWQAVEGALSRWREGQVRPERFLVGNTWVEVLDETWAAGQKIQSYEIVSEEVNANGPRIYTVKLYTAKGAETTRYYVIGGTDLIWVYSEPDYQRMKGAAKGPASGAGP